MEISFIVSLAISFVALLISLLSYLFTKRSWYETYRPIVSAGIESNRKYGIESTLFKLYVYNTGNRPAVSIKLRTDKKVLEKEFGENASKELTNKIKACFSDEAIIPLLHAGNCKSCELGIYSSKEKTMKDNKKFSIIIEYKDLYKRKYKTKQKLIWKESIFFEGSARI